MNDCPLYSYANSVRAASFSPISSLQTSRTVIVAFLLSYQQVDLLQPYQQHSWMPSLNRDRDNSENAIALKLNMQQLHFFG